MGFTCFLSSSAFAICVGCSCVNILISRLRRAPIYDCYHSLSRFVNSQSRIRKSLSSADLDDAIPVGSWCITELFDTTQSWLGRVFVEKSHENVSSRKCGFSRRILTRTRIAWYQTTQDYTRILLVRHHQDRPTFVFSILR